MDPTLGEIDVIFDPTVMYNPFVLISPNYKCLKLRLYWPLHAPPYINVKVLAVSFASITFSNLNFVLSELLTIIALKSVFYNEYIKLPWN